MAKANPVGPLSPGQFNDFATPPVTPGGSAALAAVDSALADVNNQISQVQDQLSNLKVTIPPLSEDDQDALEEAKIRAGADAYMPYDPNQANNWLLRADQLSDKQAARKFQIQMQNDPNSPQNVQKISTALNNAIQETLSPAFQLQDKDSQALVYNRINNLQDQLAKTGLGQAYAGQGNASPGGNGAPGNPTGGNAAQAQLSKAQNDAIDTQIQWDPTHTVIQNKAAILANLYQTLGTQVAQGDATYKQAQSYLETTEAQAKKSYDASQVAMEKGQAEKASADDDYNRWLEQNKGYTTSIDAGVSSLANLVRHSDNPDDAATNMAIVDSFVKSAVGGKVTAYNSGNIGSIIGSALATFSHLLGLKGQAYSDETVTNAGMAAVNEAGDAVNALYGRDTSPDKSYYKKYMAGPKAILGTVNSGAVSKFHAAKEGGTPTPAAKATPSPAARNVVTEQDFFGGN